MLASMVRTSALSEQLGVAVLLEGHDNRTASVTERFASKIRSRLISEGHYRILERTQFRTVVSEQALGFTGLTERKIIEIGKTIGAHIIIFGGVTNLSEEDIYVKYEEGEQYGGDKYRREVSLSANVRIVSVQTGENIFEREESFKNSAEGFKNIRRIYKQETKTGWDWLDLGIKIVGTLQDLDLRIQKGTQSFATLQDTCINQAVEYFGGQTISYLSNVEIKVNRPPNIPSSLNVNAHNFVDSLCRFSAAVSDPDGDKVSYQFDWGDGRYSAWSNYIENGSYVEENYTFRNEGDYSIRVRVKDTDGNESDWSAPHTISVSRYTPPPKIADDELDEYTSERSTSSSIRSQQNAIPKSIPKRFCKHCGKQVKRAATFCPFCGGKL